MFTLMVNLNWEWQPTAWRFVDFWAKCFFLSGELSYVQLRASRTPISSLLSQGKAKHLTEWWLASPTTPKWGHWYVKAALHMLGLDGHQHIPKWPRGPLVAILILIIHLLALISIAHLKSHSVQLSQVFIQLLYMNRLCLRMNDCTAEGLECSLEKKQTKRFCGGCSEYCCMFFGFFSYVCPVNSHTIDSGMSRRVLVLNYVNYFWIKRSLHRMSCASVFISYWTIPRLRCRR